MHDPGPFRRGGILKGMLIATLAVVTIVVIMVGFVLFQAVTAKPTISTNYSTVIHDRNLEAQRAIAGPGLNQFPTFESVMLEIERANEWLAQQNRSMQTDPDDPWAYVSFDQLYLVPDEGTPEQFDRARQRARDALDEWRRRGIFERTAELATLERTTRPPTEGGLDNFTIPHLGTSRGLARAQAARAHEAARADDAQQWLTTIEEMFVLGRQVAELGFLIDWLVGIAVSSLAQAALLDTLLLYPIEDDAALERLQMIVEREVFDRPLGLWHVMLNERSFAADFVQRSYTDNGNGNGRFIPLAHARLIGEDPTGTATALTPFGDTKLSNAHGMLFLDRRSADTWLDGAWDLIQAAAQASGQDAAAADRALDEYYDTADWRNPIASTNAHFVNVMQGDRRYRIQAAGVLVVLAIERYRLRNDGAVPETLDQLGDLLPEPLRRDPFTEQPWIYEPTPMTSDDDGEALRDGARAWPYTVRSRPLPRYEAEHDWSRTDPYLGILITSPINGPQYDEQ